MLVAFSDLDDPLGFSLEKMGIGTVLLPELMLRNEDQRAVPLTHLKLYLSKSLTIKGCVRVCVCVSVTSAHFIISVQ